MNNIKNYNKKLLIIFILLVATLTAFATDIKKINKYDSQSNPKLDGDLIGREIIISNSDTLYTDKYKNLNQFTKIKFGIEGLPSERFLRRFTANLFVKVTPILLDGSYGNSFEKKLKIEYKPYLNSGLITNLDEVVIKNSRGVIVFIEDFFFTINGLEVHDNPGNIYLELEYNSERYCSSNVDLAPNGIESKHIVSESNTDGIAQELKFIWDTDECTEEYELEWTWVDNYDKDETEIKFSLRDFELNNSRVRLKKVINDDGKQNYTIPIVFHQGFVLYRIRKISRFLENSTKKYYGAWSFENDEAITIADWATNAKTIINKDEAHEVRKNWQFQTSYAENGKKKEVISYFDGTLRNRQTVTKINTNNKAIVGEVIYDNQGRPAIEVLPVPVKDSIFKFYGKKSVYQNLVEGTDVIYTHRNFDWEDLNATDCTELSLTEAMDNNKGAANYYSNNYSDSSWQVNVPDSDGFPFSQIQYTSDNTGRIKRKGGVGLHYQLGNDSHPKHEMKYLYATPEQNELNRLFGYEVGKSLHYKKNAVIDPNGQISLSYIDPQGRTIATALADYTPKNLIGLEDESNEQGKMVANLLESNTLFSTGNFGSLQDGIAYNGQKMILGDNLYTFKYEFNNTNFNFGCLNLGTNYPFVYDFQLSVKDKCGEILPSENGVTDNDNKTTIGSYSTTNTPFIVNVDGTDETIYNYEDVNLVGDSESISTNLEDYGSNEIALKTGTINITKRVSVNKDALNFFADDYIRKYLQGDLASDCNMLSIDDFTPNAVLDGCYQSCQECVDSFENYTVIKADGTTLVGKIAYVYERVLNYDTEGWETSEIDALRTRFENEFDLLVTACQEPCVSAFDSIITCSNNLQVLLDDMKPKGQYGIKHSYFDENSNYIEDEFITDWVSVYSETNKLRNFSYNTIDIDDDPNEGAVYSGSWRNPNHYETDGQHYYDTNGNISYIIVDNLRQLDSEGNQLFPDEIVSDPSLYIENSDGTFSIEPQYLVNVDNFIDFFKDSWSESLVKYHPEYDYYIYTNSTCSSISTISVNGENVEVNSDGFDSLLNSIADSSNSDINQFLPSSTTSTDILALDPFFNSDIPIEFDITDYSGSNETYPVIKFHHKIMHYALSENYEESGKTLSQMAYSQAFCNSISNCEITSYDYSGLDDEEKSDFWIAYRGLYLSLKSKIQSTARDVYAYRKSRFNGCIGADDSNIDNEIGSLLSHYVNVINFQDNDITQGDSSDLCDFGDAVNYINKTKRFLPAEGGLYDSSDDDLDIIETIEQEVDLSIYIETGRCPLERDVEFYLDNIFKDLNIENTTVDNYTQPYTDNYLSRDLYEDLGGEIPATVSNSTFDINYTTDLNLSVGIGSTTPITLAIPVNTQLEDGTIISWNNYSTEWRILQLRGAHYTTFEVATTPILFNFQIIARIHDVDDADTTSFTEIILDGTTIARIGECYADDSAIGGNPIGEPLPNPGIDGTDCCDEDILKAEFTENLREIMNALLSIGELDSDSYPLGNLGVYQTGFIQKLIEDENHSAIWSYNGHAYTINNHGIIFEISITNRNPFGNQLLTLNLNLGGTIMGTCMRNGEYGSINKFNASSTVTKIPKISCPDIACGYIDFDNDGINDGCDNCPNTYNPRQIDSDGDGIGDLCDSISCGDIDSDDDGIYNKCDNCSEDYNPDQTDTDGDDIGDVCDPCPSGDCGGDDSCASISPGGNRGYYIVEYDLVDEGIYSIDFNAQSVPDRIEFTYNTTSYDSRFIGSDSYRDDLLELSARQRVLDKNTYDPLNNSWDTEEDGHEISRLIDSDLNLNSGTGNRHYRIDIEKTASTDDTLIFSITGCPSSASTGWGLNIVCPNGNPIVRKSMRYMEFREKPEEDCDCIPQTVDLVSCTDGYNNYLSLMESIHYYESGTVDNTLYVLPSVYDDTDYFCRNNLQYLVEGYKEYLDIMEVDYITHPQYLDLEHFGMTDLNYGFDNYLPLIHSYKIHIDNMYSDDDGDSIPRYLEDNDGDGTPYYLDDNDNNASIGDDTLEMPYGVFYWKSFVTEYLKNNKQICPPRPMLSTSTFVIDPEDINNDCITFNENVVGTYESDAFETYLNSIKEEFKADYISNAIGNLNENFTMEFDEKEYQYTLYYYDQAGNLIQTVPPEGVDRKDDIDNDAVNTYRINPTGTAPAIPNHRLKTQYKYNSLNQLIWQKTPDGGETVFAYDKLGRIIASQNDKQKNLESTINHDLTQAFSYTLYDGLGRITEAGQVFSKPEIVINDGALNEELFQIIDSGIRTEVSRTKYDDLNNPTIESKFEEYSYNSRGRVVEVKFYEKITPFSKRDIYQNAIYYDYDIHGNVKEIVREINDPFLVENRQQFKKTKYNYDLISGNVNKVTYQRGKRDQFIHKYEYDADNRITNVQTSKDGVIWEHDARYNYYDHGPLARTVLGEHQVQGLDYAYTLQGWLKAVNSDRLSPDIDMGKDGFAQSTIAKDAFAYALHYYQGDYKDRATGTTPFLIRNTDANDKNLYNGNIKSMITSILDEHANPINTSHNDYQYDQLNRIKSMSSTEINSTGAATEGISSSYNYDRNGNLSHLNRKAKASTTATPIEMDEFEYIYDTTKKNRLLRVKDNTGYDDRFDVDIDNQEVSNNYGYDKIGQLVYDKAENLAKIEWTVSGKVKRIFIFKKDYAGFNIEDDTLFKTEVNNKLNLFLSTGEVNASLSEILQKIITFEYDALGNRLSKAVKDFTLSCKDKYTTFYIRDAQGNVLSVYKKHTNEGCKNIINDKFVLKEQNIYGSSRIGLQEANLHLVKSNSKEAKSISEPVTDRAMHFDTNYEATINENFDFSFKNKEAINVGVLLEINKPDTDGIYNIAKFESQNLDSIKKLHQLKLDLKFVEGTYRPQLTLRTLKDSINIKNVVFSFSNDLKNDNLNINYDIQILDEQNDKYDVILTIDKKTFVIGKGINQIVTYEPYTESHTSPVSKIASNLENPLDFNLDQFSYAINGTKRNYNFEKGYGNPISSDGQRTLQTSSGSWVVRGTIIRNYQRIIGDKRYELSNHLGNVLSVISDHKALSSNYGEDKIIYHTTFSKTEEPWKNSKRAGINLEEGRLRIKTGSNLNGANGYYHLEAGITYNISIDVDIDRFRENLEFSIWKGRSKVFNRDNTFYVRETGTISLTFTPDESRTYRLNFRMRNREYEGEAQIFYIDNVIISIPSKEIISLSYIPEVLSYNDYYPFGMTVPNRSYSSPSYRYGFQGQEKDDEIKGNGNSVNYKYRMHDPRVGRFFAVDPLVHKYPWYTPYQFSGNTPIMSTELEGLEPIVDENNNLVGYTVQKNQGPTQISEDINNSDTQAKYGYCLQKPVTWDKVVVDNLVYYAKAGGLNNWRDTNMLDIDNPIYKKMHSEIGDDLVIKINNPVAKQTKPILAPKGTILKVISRDLISGPGGTVSALDVEIPTTEQVNIWNRKAGTGFSLVETNSIGPKSASIGIFKRIEYMGKINADLKGETLSDALRNFHYTERTGGSVVFFGDFIMKDANNNIIFSENGTGSGLAAEATNNSGNFNKLKSKTMSRYDSVVTAKGDKSLNGGSEYLNKIKNENK